MNCAPPAFRTLQQLLSQTLTLLLAVGFLLATAAQVNASTHSYVQTLELQTSTDLYARDIAADSDNSIIVVGEFAGTATLASGTPEEVTLTSAGNYDIFLAKYLSNGTLSWAVNIGDTGDDRAFSVAIDSTDAILVAGTYSDTVAFNGDSGSPGDSERTSNGNSDAFVVKYSSNGVYSWVRAWGNSDYDYNYAVTVDSDDAVYSGGTFHGTVDFDPSGSTNDLSGTYSAFFSKFSGDGTYEWTQVWDYSGGSLGIGDPNPVTEVHSLVVSSDGGVYVGGIYNGQVDFDPGAGDDTQIPVGDYDFFISKYSTDGVYQDVFVTGSSEAEYVHDLAVDDAGNLYAAGQFSDGAYFDGLGEIDRSGSVGARDAFVLSLNNSLVYRWHHTWGGISHDSASGLVLSSGSTPMVYVTGFFNDSVVFEPGGSDNDTSAGDQDAYAISFDSSGTYDWHTVWGNSGTDQGTSVALTSEGGLFLAGYYANTVDFDFTGEIDQHSATGTTDGYVTEYFVPITSESATSNNTGSVSSESQGLSAPSTPGCAAEPPVGVPDLFQIARNGPQATLYFSPVKNNVSGYFISYGDGDNTEGYGVSFPYSDTSGAISYTVSALDPARSYTFKVRAGNGCATGLWSQTIKVGPARTQLADTASSASQAVLGGLMLVGINSAVLLALRTTRYA